MEPAAGLPDWVTAVLQLGFPIVVCAWLLLRIEVKLEAWTKAMVELTKVVELLALRVQFLASDTNTTVPPTQNRYVP